MIENEKMDVFCAILNLWQQRKTILWFVLVFLVIGTAVAFLLPRKYTAKCTMGLEAEDRTTRISLEGLPGFQTMNMADVRNEKIITPAMYPDILFSVPFQKELIYTPLYVDVQGDTMTFYKYYVDHYGDLKEKEAEERLGQVEQLTLNEKRCLKYLRQTLKIEINSKNGYLKFSLSMRDPRIAALIAHQVQGMLQKYIAKFRIAKTQAALDFIEERYIEVKKELEQKQQALISFREKHKKDQDAYLQAEEKVLTNDYDLFFELYSNIVKQREKAKIQVKENMPVLTVIEPVVEPTDPSTPSRFLIIFISLVLGGIVGASWVLIKPLFAEVKKA